MDNELNKIKRLRNSLGLSQSQFAKKFGISTKTVQHWEGEKDKLNDRLPSILMIERIIELEREVERLKGYFSDY